MTGIECYMNKKYPILIVEDPIEGGYTVSIPDLPGCITCCQRWQDIPATIEDARRAWMEELQKAGILEGHVKGEYI